MSNGYNVGCYYFPGYHRDPRNEKIHGQGWTEWRLVQSATPRFPGHRQPLVPQWGYEDEADPKVMERKIDAAVDHGLDYWIFDWYWYKGPFLQRCLDEAFMKARNNSRIKFCCMWANHDWIDLHPAKVRTPGQVKFSGEVTPAIWKTIMKWMIEHYFKHPSHFMVNGMPYFAIYDLAKLIGSFGGIADTRAALNDFRNKTKGAGFPGLHLNAVVWGNTILPGESVPVDPVLLVRELGFNSVTSYVWVHHVGLPKYPVNSYVDAHDAYLKHWDWALANFNIPYFPNVTMGWDSSPRTVQTDVWEPGQPYPHGHMIEGNTPDAFQKALRITKERLDKQNGPKILNINAWNEWTEGSYLEPDSVHGMKYLDAIKTIFGK